MSRPKLHRRLPPTLAARVASKTAPHFTSEATSEVKSEVTSEARTPQVPDASNALIMRGDYWEARYCGRTVMLDEPLHDAHTSSLATVVPVANDPITAVE